MKGGTINNITAGLFFFGFLFVIMLLLPRISAANLTGNNNDWTSQSAACPGWGQSTTLTVSTTINSYIAQTNYPPSNPDEWGWQENGAASAQTEFNFYQFGQTTGPYMGVIGTGVGVQINPKDAGITNWGTVAQQTTWYIGTAGSQAISTLMIDGQQRAVGAAWEVINAAHQVLIDTSVPWPQFITRNGVQYTLWNLVLNFQNDFVGIAIPGQHVRADFVSGSGQFTWSGADISNGCHTITTGEDSEMVYAQASCNAAQCTQTFNAPSGYENHNSPGGNIQVAIGGGWGTDTVGVEQGDLLVVTEGTYSGGVTFTKPVDTFTNNWIQDGGGTFCSANDCVAVWHAISNNHGTDTVTFHTSDANDFTYGFVREFVGYNGGTSNTRTDFGSSGAPHVVAISPAAGDLIVAVAADTMAGWQPSSKYYMIGANSAWSAATEFTPDWQSGTTTATWTTPTNGNWAEIAIEYKHL